MRLTKLPGERERAVLELLVVFRFMTRAQLQAFLFGTEAVTSESAETMTRRCLWRLEGQGLARQAPRAIGGPGAGSGASVYFATTAGYRACAPKDKPTRRSAPRGTFLVNHALATVEVALAFRRAALLRQGHALAEWVPDWEAAEATGNGRVIPDVYAIYATPDEDVHLFIEVDMGTAGTKFFAAKLARYLALYRTGSVQRRLGVWPVVATVALNSQRVLRLREATERLIASQQDRARVAASTEFDFATLSDLQQRGPLAPVWHVAGSSRPRDLLGGEAS